jgi:hypothetical protein
LPAIPEGRRLDEGRTLVGDREELAEGEEEHVGGEG